jgi:hypothetical protein
MDVVGSSNGCHVRLDAKKIKIKIKIKNKFVSVHTKVASVRTKFTFALTRHGSRKKGKKKVNFFFLLVFEGLYLMQLCLGFRTFFFVEWICKSGLPCKFFFAKSSYHFSLADGMADKGPTFVWTLGELIGF